MSKTPDERSIMTYVSEYYLVMSQHQQEQDPVVAEELPDARADERQTGRTAIGPSDDRQRPYQKGERRPSGPPAPSR